MVVHTTGERAPEDRIAAGLGWFSNGLAAAQLFMPRRFSRMIGLRDDGMAPTVVRLIGLREAAAGAGILARERPARWVWGRVAGDAMDIGLLAYALAAKSRSRTRLGVAAASVVGVTVLDALTAKALGDADATGDGAVHVRHAVTVNKPQDEVYEFWKDFENFPRFMAHLESVTATGDGRSHWVAKAPAGRTVEWDAETTRDVPNELVAWRSVGSPDVANEGSVVFRAAPGDRGTEVHVDIDYRPPAGALGKVVAKLFGEEPSVQLHDDLRRFKQVIETGEVVRSDGSPEGESLAQHLKQRAAQPQSASERSTS